MTHYIYSSALRRTAKVILEDEGASLTIAMVGDRPRDAQLFGNVATGIVQWQGDSERPPLMEFDFILCGASDLALVEAAMLAVDRGNTAVLGIAVRGPVHEFTADHFERIASLCTGLGLTLVSQQAASVAFRHDKLIVFVLASTADLERDVPLSLLKTAVFLEAHSLQGAALELVRAFNKRVTSPAHAIDTATIDRTYEVERFATAEYSLTRSDWASAAARNALGNVLAWGQDFSDGSSQLGRFLSIHFDQLHRSDGEARLRQLARSLVMPEKVEIVVRMPTQAPAGSWPALAAELAQHGIAVKVFHDAASPGNANPCAHEFLAATASEARIAVYYAEYVPDAPGWDYDLLRAASTAEGRVFALKASNHKTRYYVTREDAEDAPEHLPVVSRAWLEACTAWSVPGVPASVFQTLVAFYFDRTDWTNKHRLLRLYRVMSMSTRPVEPEEGRMPTSRQKARYRSAIWGAQRRAIECALKLHAAEWEGPDRTDRLIAEYHPERRRLSLRGQTGRKAVKSWQVPRDRSRLPF